MGNQKKILTAEEQSEKKKSILITVCVILAAVLIIGLVAYARLADSGVLLRSKTAAESENFEISGTMMAYFYNSNYQNYYSYLSYLGVDTSVSLKQQECSYAEGGTWFDYFVAMTKDYTNNLLALCEGAKKNGIELDDSDIAEIEESLDQIEATAKTYGYSTNQYLAALTGSGVNLKDVRKCMELTSLAAKYSEVYEASLTYTSDELQAYYDAHTADYDGVDYYVYTVNSSDFMQKDPDGNPVGDTAAASASAYEAAKKISEAAGLDEYLTLIREYMTDTKGMEENDVEAAVTSAFNRHVVASSISSISDWAFSASAGDVYLTGEEGDSAFAVYCLTKASYRDETPTRNVRHILFSRDTYEDDSKANEIYAEWEASGFSEDKFIELANTYSEDTGSNTNGGLYENVTIGSTTNEFNAWLFDDSRKVGDHGIVESSAYGWHIMYYVGEGDSTSWETEVTSDLKSEDYTAMVEENSASVTYDDKVISQINA